MTSVNSAVSQHSTLAVGYVGSRQRGLRVCYLSTQFLSAFAKLWKVF